ncbi:MAG: hypothetical protein VB089_15570 [Anaerolineaceae bacterium]|nr:hypothetical protein [Anaerolineaceae bacterium]
MNEPKRFSLVKPTLITPLHIDFEWWKDHDNNWKVYLQSYLCPLHQTIYSDLDENSKVDWIDPETAEIQTVDGLQHILMSHCARQEGFITSNTTLVDAVFRSFLANGNTPQTPEELAAQIDRPAETILRTLAGPTVYKGLRPCNC